MIEIVSAVIASVSAVFAFWQFRRIQALTQLQSLFQAFDAANQATLDSPEILRSVHGLEGNDDELKMIAYLSVLMDGFQHFADGDYSKLLNDDTFLNRILAVPDNQTRWERMKSVYYGTFDREFITVIDRLIEKGNRKDLGRCHGHAR